MQLEIRHMHPGHAGGFCLICEASLFEASEEACCHGHLSAASGAQIKFYMYGMTK